MPDDIHIKNRDDLENWLISLPEDIRWQAATAIASRAALRVLPLLEVWLARDEEEAISITLPTFRGASTSWLAAVGAGYRMEVQEAVIAAARTVAVIGDADGVPDDAALIINAALNAVIATGTVADTMGVAVSADAVYAAALTDAAAVWKATEADVRTIAVDPGAIPAILTKTPLWPTGTPDWAVESWQSMKRRLLAREGEHWHVWTTWYDARLDPSRRIPCYSPPDLELEEARVLLPDELWEQGPAAVNARIKALLEESGCAIQPPPQLDGIHFRFDEDGRLDEEPQQPDEDEASDPLLVSMFQRLRQKLAALMQEMERVGNQYPTLNNVLRDYDREISSITSLQELDIPAAWMAGQGVMAQAEAFRNMVDEALTPRLEPEMQGLLEEVAGLHGAFITGFRLGRTLTVRRLQAQAGPEAVDQLQEAEQHFIEKALKLPDEAITPRVRGIFSMIRDIQLSNEIKADEKVGITISSIYNAIGVVGERLDRFLDSRTAQFIATGMGQSGLVALANLFQEAAGPIAAIAQFTPEMRAYIHYLFERHAWNRPGSDEQDKG